MATTDKQNKRVTRAASAGISRSAPSAVVNSDVESSGPDDSSNALRHQRLGVLRLLYFFPTLRAEVSSAMLRARTGELLRTRRRRRESEAAIEPDGYPLADPTNRGWGLQLAAMRLLLASIGCVLVALLGDAAVHSRAFGSSLAGYLAYSIVMLYVVTREQSRPQRLAYWIDLGFAAYVVAMTGGVGSIFLFFFLFPIIAAAFSLGAREALAMNICAVLFTLLTIYGSVGETLAPPLVIARPVGLFALGYLLGRLGDVELQNRRCIRLLAAISGSADIRLGCDRLINLNLQRLLHHFGADAALLVLKSAEHANPRLYRVDRADAQQRAPAALAAHTAQHFLTLPASGCIHPQPRTVQLARMVMSFHHAVMDSDGSTATCTALAELLNAPVLVAVGYTQLHGTDGRLVLIKAQEAFSLRDRTFLTQCGKALGVVAANACLTDKLIASAADDERRTICRDLHDTAVQPYLGLKLALEAMARDFAEHPAVVERVHRVKNITEAAVEELRTYTANLRGRTVAPATSVRAAIERHAARLGRFYGLQVMVRFDPELRIEGRIAEAIFQLVAEALSNVLRHTASRRARVDVGADGRAIMVQVANRWPDDSPKPPPFVPRSIEERALELGGRVRIRMNDDRWTLVNIELPDRCSM